MSTFHVIKESRNELTYFVLFTAVTKELVPHVESVCIFEPVTKTRLKDSSLGLPVLKLINFILSPLSTIRFYKLILLTSEVVF